MFGTSNIKHNVPKYVTEVSELAALLCTKLMNVLSVRGRNVHFTFELMKMSIK